MIIELAVMEDAQEILNLQKLAYQSEAVIYHDYSIPPLTQTLEQTRDDFAKQTVLKATSEGQVIGSVRGYLSQGTCYIGKLIVHPDFQNQGIGSRLMAAIEGHFSQAQRYELFTGQRSERNLYLYQKLGYRVMRTEGTAGKVAMVFLEKTNHPERPLSIHYRQITSSDQAFLWEMLYQAIFVPPGEVAPARQEVYRPELRRYVQDWGKPGDAGWLALVDGVPVGAAWLRLLTGEQRGYGYIDDQTPELSIAILPEQRGRGLGSRLLALLLEDAQQAFNAISLSVSLENPAQKLYRRLGFEVVEQSSSSLTMIKRWAKPKGKEPKGILQATITAYLPPFHLSGLVRRDVPAYLLHFGFAHTAKHCAGVASEAKQLAPRFGADPEAAEASGWLHDVSAVVPDDQRIGLAENLGLDILPEERSLPMILHQKLSAVFARDIFGIQDAAILSAIGCHTTLKAGASTLDKIVFLADKIRWDQPGTPPYQAELLAALEHSLPEALDFYLRYRWERREMMPVIHPWFEAAYHAETSKSP